MPQKLFSILLKGSLTAKAELGAGVEKLAKVAVGAKGTLISIEALNLITKSSGSFVSNNNIVISGGEITCFAYGKVANLDVFDISKKFLKGWSKVIR